MSPEGAPPPPTGPDESKFKAMELEAAAAGPAAEARRQEMARWADAQGQYADRAAAETVKAGEDAVKAGMSGEQVDAAMSRASERAAKGRQGSTLGVLIDDPNPGIANNKTVATPREGGMNIGNPSFRGTELRSPAQIAKDEEAKKLPKTPEEDNSQAA